MLKKTVLIILAVAAALVLQAGVMHFFHPDLALANLIGIAIGGIVMLTILDRFNN